MGKTDFKFHTTLRVRWGECDRQGIVYYGAYLDYLETAQGAYYRNLGFSLYKLAETGHFDTATVKVTIQYKAPALVEDLLDVCFRVAGIGSTSITACMEIYRHRTETLLTWAEAVYVGYDASTGSKKAVPDDLRAVIQSYEDTGTPLSLDAFPELAKARVEPDVPAPE